ncbi:MAG: DUF4845 domain-containing protein [Brachymonas sp.]|nr:DUF4845 domain-containing protein [Brachymonas sp.]
MQSSSPSLLAHRKQQGFSFMSMIFVAVIVGVLFVLAAKIVPSLIEFQAIKKAINRASDQQTVAEIERAFNASASIDDITSIAGKDLEVTKENDRVVIRFAYDKEIVLVGPVSLLIHFSGNSQGRGA